MKNVYFFYLFFIFFIFTSRSGNKYIITESSRSFPNSRPASSVLASNLSDYTGGLVVIESGLRLTQIYIDAKGEIDVVIKTKGGKNIAEKKGMRNGGVIKLRNLEPGKYELKLKIKKTNCKEIIFEPSSNPRTQKFRIKYDY